jgi:hypothetical protein
MLTWLSRQSRTRLTLLLALALAAILGLCFLLWSETAADDTAVGTVGAVPFNQSAAINLAGEQVPPDVDGFYLYVMEPDRALADESAELAGKLRQAAAERDYLGIIGVDPERNHQILIEALHLAREHSLSGAIVIYLGPSELAEDVAERLGTAGADLRYVVYPAVAGAPI